MSGPGVTVRVTAGPRDSVTSERPEKYNKKKLKVNKPKSDRVKLKWTRNSESRTYTVQLRKCNNDTAAECIATSDYQKKNKFRVLKKIRKVNKMVKKLDSETYYQWRLKGCNAAGCGKYSPWVRFKTIGL